MSTRPSPALSAGAFFLRAALFSELNPSSITLSATRDVYGLHPSRKEGRRDYLSSVGLAAPPFARAEQFTGHAR